MMEKLIKTSDSSDKELTFEIGSNSDLILENTITNNLVWTIDRFAESKKGFRTFPTKFSSVDPILQLKHKDKVIVRMSVNPDNIIRKIEIGTSSLKSRVDAINKLAGAGYKTGLLIAPVILIENWTDMYSGLIDYLSENLCEEIQNNGFIEIIFMTYSYVHNAINTETFPNAVNLYDKNLMTGRGMGKYTYKESARKEAEIFLKNKLKSKLGNMKILYKV